MGFQLHGSVWQRVVMDEVTDTYSHRFCNAVFKHSKSMLIKQYSVAVLTSLL